MRKLTSYTVLPLLQVSCDNNLQAYTMFIYLKREIMLVLSIIIKDKRCV